MLEIKDKNGNKVQKSNLNDEIKIIFTDLDGTLLNSENKISKLNLESLLKVKEKDVKIVFATGRPLYSVEGIIDEELKKHNINLMPGIYLNGCVTYDPNGKRIIDNVMNDDIKMEIHNFSKKENISQYFIWYSIDATYCFSMNDSIREYIEVECITPKVLSEEEFKKLTVYKVLMCLREDNLSNILKLCKEKFSHKLNVANTFKCYIEMFNCNTNKFEGVKKICKFYNISLNNALSIGDGENDMEMLEGLANSVSLINASNKVKSSAKYIAPSNNDNAIFHVLKTFCNI
ncbi:haloacid dehalogenase-like hydrolase, putative [Plasmodium malariae]|uniref:Haloacid dehalogenase-like hydrolase, putative n=1 Tax=Plasmodium malariae TaxID=5858 RepID=A0A1A8VS93_PLAMA|nr:haloacid dehalogenase-like hydrolase, putative [Plasmodium malariae]SBS83400.1 haloacid dehalogenase-like hydrolase, putative (HAD1) [Plasmodium malariae]SCN45187.1 haloacid dehalogenase-like hydrolase, putative [Plasmodium malariae]